MIETRRSEVQVAADVVHLLLVHGIIDRKRWGAGQICEAVGITVNDLKVARFRCESRGADALQPDRANGEHVEAAEPLAVTERRERRRPRLGHPGEKLCARCGEWVPTTEFDQRGPTDPRPKKMCRVCASEFDRDHFVAVRKAAALHQVVASVTAMRGDPFVGRTCPNCGEPFVLGQCVTITGEPVHADCPKVKR